MGEKESEQMPSQQQYLWQFLSEFPKKLEIICLNFVYGGHVIGLLVRENVRVIC